MNIEDLLLVVNSCNIPQVEKLLFKHSFQQKNLGQKSQNLFEKSFVLQQGYVTLCSTYRQTKFANGGFILRDIIFLRGKIT
jgi:hypothetical protein